MYVVHSVYSTSLAYLRICVIMLHIDVVKKIEKKMCMLCTVPSASTALSYLRRCNVRTRARTRACVCVCVCV